MKVAVLGGSGFVGSAVVRAFRARGVVVEVVHAPRLKTTARDAAGMVSACPSDQVELLQARLSGHDVVVIAAGIADAAAADSDSLFGANSLLALVVSRAVTPGTRVVLVSSAAVQGRVATLDESTATRPFSPYSRSKAIGEQLVLERDDSIVFRPTSVQGPGREVTERLVRFLSSPLASVAGRGDRPTPQVHIENVGDAIAFTGLAEDVVTRVVLQPHEGLTTESLVRLLADREPRRVPVAVASAVVRCLRLTGLISGRLAATGRRLEMLWFGQAQRLGWLDAAGWRPVVGHEAWRALGASSARNAFDLGGDTSGP